MPKKHLAASRAGIGQYTSAAKPGSRKPYIAAACAGHRRSDTANPGDNIDTDQVCHSANLPDAAKKPADADLHPSTFATPPAGSSNYIKMVGGHVKQAFSGLIKAAKNAVSSSGVGKSFCSNSAQTAGAAA